MTVCVTKGLAVIGVMVVDSGSDGGDGGGSEEGLIGCEEAGVLSCYWWVQ